MAEASWMGRKLTPEEEKIVAFAKLHWAHPETDPAVEFRNAFPSPINEHGLVNGIGVMLQFIPMDQSTDYVREVQQALKISTAAITRLEEQMNKVFNVGRKK